MELLILGVLIVVGVIVSIVHSRSAALARWITCRAVFRLAHGHQSRYDEEWTAHLDEYSGALNKLLHAVGFIRATAQLRNQIYWGRKFQRFEIWLLVRWVSRRELLRFLNVSHRTVRSGLHILIEFPSAQSQLLRACGLIRAAPRLINQIYWERNLQRFEIRRLREAQGIRLHRLTTVIHLVRSSRRELKRALGGDAANGIERLP